eukprot:17761-Heterococcus_DN1.PRE.4
MPVSEVFILKCILKLTELHGTAVMRIEASDALAHTVAQKYNSALAAARSKRKRLRSQLAGIASTLGSIGTTTDTAWCNAETNGVVVVGVF